MSPEITLDPYAHLYSEAATLAKSSAVRDLLSVTGRTDIISFAGGLPYTRGLPLEDVTRVMNEVLAHGSAEALQYGETEGRDDLKARLVEIMAEEGISAEPEHMLITTGSQQALDLLGRAFIDHGDTIVMEGPTYIGALTAFLPNAPRIVGIPLDDGGMRTDILASELRRASPPPKFVYSVPNFHNPAGVTMALERRDHLLELLEEYDLLLLEDNPYGLLRFEGEPVAPLASRDSRHVVYLGTLSKIISPGIRVGWILAPAPIIERIIPLKGSADLCSSNLNQMFAEAYIAEGLWRKNLEAIRKIYRLRRDAMLRALEKHFPEGSRWTHPEGGLFIWATLPEYLDTAKMLPAAIEQKVAYVPGSAFYADGSGANQMRMNFSFSDETDIAEGVKRLGKVIRKEIDLYRSLGLDRPGRVPPGGGR